MQCPTCQQDARKFGRDRDGNQRYQCLPCKKTFSERPVNPLGSMRIEYDKALQVLEHLLEGVSVRATMRLTKTNRATILKLLTFVGENCERLLANRIRNVPVNDVQVDEVWGYVFCKERTRTRSYPEQEGVGDAYCFIGMERTTKLILAWHLGRRESADTHEFARKLADATAGQFQISTDGFRPYQTAIPSFFQDADFATIVKSYATREDEHRYSPGEVNGTTKTPQHGNPDPDRVCTSHVERGNLTVRMQDRRMTRLTNAFSKKWRNHSASMALHFAYFNYCRKHMTLKTTPAVAAGLEIRPWTLPELVERSTLG